MDKLKAFFVLTPSFYPSSPYTLAIMSPSRRQVVLAGVGAGSSFIAGCLETSDEGNADDGEPGAPTDEPNDDNESCDPLDLPLTDEPPHDPERPPQPDDVEEADEWDEHYLGARMEETPDLGFDRINLRFREPVVDVTEFDGDSVIYAKLLTSREDFEELVEPVGDDAQDRAQEIDFDVEAVVVVLSGFGSSSVRHEWVRLEDNCDELHLHGYYRQPWIQTGDYTTRVSGVVVDRPAEHEVARVWVSLTTSEETRVNIASDADLQRMNGDDDDHDDIPETPGPLQDIDIVPASAKSPGAWHSEATTDDTGVVVSLDTEEEVQVITEDSENVERFIELTDFDEDFVYFVESVGPNACYRRLEFGEFVVVANDDGYFLTGQATAVTDSRLDVCAEVITYPGTLLRVDSEVALSKAEFRITDGWGEQTTIESITMSEFAKE